jgi:hypothetical protein
MATAGLTVLAPGRSDVSASAYIAELQRRLAAQDHDPAPLDDLVQAVQLRA